MQLIPLVFLLSTAAPVSAARSPLICTGWDSPNARQFRDGVAAFERWGTFDGTTIQPTRRTKDGVDRDAKHAFSHERWQWGDFAQALADLRAARPTTCRENYLMLYANPGDVDWFDDDGWAEIVNHWRLLARLARQGGLRGLLYDAEPYVKPYSQFLYRAQAGRDQHTFAQYVVQARRRGREVMQAVRQEFPDITIFSYRLFSDMLDLLESGDLATALEADTYGLQPAFVDGWLDVAAPGMKVIEGTEDPGYKANSLAQYQAAFAPLRLKIADFVAPEHREAANRQFRIGQSLFLDAYVSPPQDTWHIPHVGSTPAARLASNVASALATSDGLVWLYGEHATWWPHARDKPTWPDKLPGAIAALRRARDPITFARDFFAQRPAPKNLLRNDDFALTGPAAAPPDGWFVWQDDASHGQLTSAGGRIELRAVLDGVFGQAVAVKPGHSYAVKVHMKTQGRGLGALRVGWKTAAGKWTPGDKHTFVATGPGGADGWREIVGVVEVPPDAGLLIFMPSAASQFGESDRCWFDDAALAEIPD